MSWLENRANAVRGVSSTPNAPTGANTPKPQGATWLSNRAETARGIQPVQAPKQVPVQQVTAPQQSVQPQQSRQLPEQKSVNTLTRIKNFISSLLSEEQQTEAPQMSVNEQLFTPIPDKNKFIGSSVALNDKGDIVQPSKDYLPIRAEFHSGQIKEETLWGRVKNFLGKPFKATDEELNARAGVAVAVREELAKKHNVPVNDIDIAKVENNLDEYTKELGVRTNLNNREFLDLMMALAIPVTGGVSAKLLVGIGVFSATSALIDEGIYRATGKEGGIVGLLPSDASRGTKDLVGIIDIFGKALITHGVSKKAPEVRDFFTKQKMTEYNVPEKVSIDAEKIRSIFQTGEKISPQEMDLVKGLGLSKEQWRMAVKEGIKIESPTEKVITITDRPYWAKIKSFIGLPESTPVEIRQSVGQKVDFGVKKQQKEVKLLQEKSGNMPEAKPTTPVSTPDKTLPIETIGTDTQVFRGTTVKGEALDVTKANGLTRGESTSLDRAVAERFATKKGGEVQTYTIDKDAKVINHSYLEELVKDVKEPKQKLEVVDKFIKDNGIDIVRFDVPEGSLGEGELRIINPDVVTLQKGIAETRPVKQPVQEAVKEPVKEIQPAEFNSNFKDNPVGFTAGDIVIDTKGNIKEVVSGNAEWVSGKGANSPLKDNNVGYLRTKLLGEEKDYIDYANQVRKLTDEELAVIKKGKAIKETKQPEKSPVEEDIKALESKINKEYSSKSELFEQSLGEIWAELDVAEAGQRVFTGEETIGIKSTFPQWVPEELRSKELFDIVMGNLSDPTKLKYPEGNRTRQRALYDAILDELDSRVGTDTREARSAIIGAYENLNRAKAEVTKKPDRQTKKTIRGSTKRSEGTTPQAKTEQQKTVEGLSKDIQKAIEDGNVDFLNKVKQKVQGTSEEASQYKQALIEAKRLSEAGSVRDTSGVYEDASLLSEARKYKSAEEFVKAQGNPILHGTEKQFEEFDIVKRGMNEKDIPARESFFFTDSLDTAKSYGKNIQERYGNFKKPLTLDADGKMYGDMREELRETILKAKKDGNDVVIVKNLSDRKDWGNYEPATHYAVLDIQSLKTKSQLTDIWNKANGKTLADSGSISKQLPLPLDNKAVLKSPYALKFKKDGFVKFAGEKASPESIAFAFKDLKNNAVESLYSIGIKNGSPVFVELLSIGTINQTLISGMDISPLVFEQDVDGVYLVHNHPSGNPQPSEEDIFATAKVNELLSKYGKKVIGHVVINTTEFGVVEGSTGRKLPLPKEMVGSKSEVPVFKKYLDWQQESYNDIVITSPKTVVDLMKGLSKDYQNVSSIIYTDTGNRVITVENIPQAVSPDAIAKKAIIARAKGVILVNPPENYKGLDLFEYFQQVNNSLKSFDIKLIDGISPRPDNTFASARENGAVREPSGQYLAGEEQDALGWLDKTIDDVVAKGGISIERDTKTIAKTPEQLKTLLDSMNKYGQKQAVLRKTGGLAGAPKGTVGLFVPPTSKKGIKGSVSKQGEVRLKAKHITDDEKYLSVLSHELGHSTEFLLTGTINKKTWEVFGDKLTPEQLSKVKEELKEVTLQLEGATAVANKPRYYNQPTEQLARFFEMYITNPESLTEIAPTALELIEEQSVKHPMIREFLEVIDENMIKVDRPGFSFLPDLRQSYQKALGSKSVGNIAYNAEINHRALVERAKKVLPEFINSKFKDVKDSPELLFKVAESIKVTKDSVPEFGTRDFVTLESKHRETSKGNALIEQGYEYVSTQTNGAGVDMDTYAKSRYTPQEAENLFNQLSEPGKQLIRDFTAQRSEAKDYFNREVIKDVNKINSNLEGWVHHYFEEGTSTTAGRGIRFKIKKAGATMRRTGKEGYVEDLQKAVTKAIVELETSKDFNYFIDKQFARVSKPIPEGQNPDAGWVEVMGNLKKGVGLEGDSRMTIIKDGKAFKAKQTRYQVPTVIYDRYKMYRGLLEEASLATKTVQRLNTYWTINVLVHGGTAGTNFIGGGIQYGSKVLTDFYAETLRGDVTYKQTRRNINAVLKTLLPKGWHNAPDWAYGGDLSNWYGQFSQRKISKADRALDQFGDKALKLFSTYERYWKKVIMLSENVSDVKSLEKVGPEGLALPTKEEEEMIALINSQVDLYAYDYDNIPLWLTKMKRSPVGVGIKPFATYPYKYAKQITNMAGSAFDPSQSWQDRTSKILALSTMMALYTAYSLDRKKKQQTPEATTPEIEIRSRSGGYLYTGITDENGQELFIRVSKYPFFGLAEAGIQTVKGNTDSASNIFKEMLGTIGFLGKVGLNLAGYRDEYEKYDDSAVIMGNNLSSLIPFMRILGDISRGLDPYKRKQETFGQTLTQFIPTTNPDLQDKLHGEIRTVKIPIEGEVKRTPGTPYTRTTVDKTLKNYWQDILLGSLTGIYIKRVDPEDIEAQIIRDEKNKKKRLEGSK